MVASDAEEHDTVLRRLTDSHSDEFALLRQYRRTFQTRREESIAELVEFLAGYEVCCSAVARRTNGCCRSLRWRELPRFLKGDPELESAISNPGLLAVAAAIRSATFGAQAARHNAKQNHREIRYGLLPQLRRAGLTSRPELLTAVSSFVSRFNLESDRRHPRRLGATHIHDAEMDAFAPVPGTIAGADCGWIAAVRAGFLRAPGACHGGKRSRPGRGSVGMIQSVSLLCRGDPCTS